MTPASTPARVLSSPLHLNSDLIKVPRHLARPFPPHSIASARRPLVRAASKLLVENCRASTPLALPSLPPIPMMTLSGLTMSSTRCFLSNKPYAAKLTTANIASLRSPPPPQLLHPASRMPSPTSWRATQTRPIFLHFGTRCGVPSPSPNEQTHSPLLSFLTPPPTATPTFFSFSLHPIHHLPNYAQPARVIS